MQVEESCFRVSLYLEDSPAIISPYLVFKITDKNILPEFFNIWHKCQNNRGTFGFKVTQASEQVLNGITL